MIGCWCSHSVLLAQILCRKHKEDCIFRKEDMRPDRKQKGTSLIPQIQHLYGLLVCGTKPAAVYFIFFVRFCSFLAATTLFFLVLLPEDANPALSEEVCFAKRGRFHALIHTPLLCAAIYTRYQRSTREGERTHTHTRPPPRANRHAKQPKPTHPPPLGTKKKNRAPLEEKGGKKNL